MGEQAVALGKAVDYQSAGTVEFIVDKDRNFYFLEMNTRLQVEHPVTELVTGVDLVEQMIRIAAGEKLAIRQSDVKLDGWAVESRLYAEDPYRNFLPSIGRLTRYRPPAEGRFGDVVIRNDTGVAEGSEISMYYDPMIAKLCTWAPTRIAAIDAMADALDEFVVDGIEHNIPFLSALMQHPRWREGRLSTGFIAEEFPDGFHPIRPGEADTAVLATIAVAVELVRRDRLDRLTRPARTAFRQAEARLGRQARCRLCRGPGVRGIGLDADQRRHRRCRRSRLLPSSPTGGRAIRVWRGTIGGTKISAQVRPVPNGIRIAWKGISATARVMLPGIAELERLMPVKVPPDMSKLLLCPMPGLVVSIAVAVGQEVKAGETLAVVEAMKMENVLRAERDVTVAKINAKPGDSLAVDAVIMEFA